MRWRFSALPRNLVVARKRASSESCRPSDSCRPAGAGSCWDRQESGDRMSVLPRDGLVAVVKRDCPTCVLAAPVLGELAQRTGLAVYTQDDPSFPETVPERIDDTALDVSYRLGIEIVPTLIRFAAGHEVGRTYGWDRGE